MTVNILHNTKNTEHPKLYKYKRLEIYRFIQTSEKNELHRIILPYEYSTDTRQWKVVNTHNSEYTR